MNLQHQYIREMQKKIKIESRLISDNSPPLLVAEISANHQNSKNKTFKILEAAAKAGLEAVKFQTFNLDDMTIKSSNNEFQIKQSFKDKKWNSRSLYSIYKEAQFPYKWHKSVFKKAKSLGLICFSSVFDTKSLKLLESLNAPAYKIASLESLHFPLIEKVCKTNKPILISTGTLDENEIQELLNFLKKIKYKKFLIMHCVSDYPTKNKDVNLKFIAKLKKKHNCLVGFSDHTCNLGASISSISFGACMVEKHFKLNKNQNSLDSKFSLTPNEMKLLNYEIKNAWLSIGKSKKKLTKGEKFVKKYRRSIYSVKNIKKGETFSVDNIKIIRPGKGLPPKFYYNLIGKKSPKDIKLGSSIKSSILK